MNKLSMPGGMSRRTFLQVSAAGVVTATTLGGVRRRQPRPIPSSPGSRRAARSRCSTTIRYWIGKKMGYFADLGVETDMQPGPSDGTATVKFVDVGQADMGFPSPGVFSFALENGMKLKSAFHMGALDTFSLAFRKGEGTNDLKTARGQDHPARLGRLAVDRRSDAGRAGRRHHQGQVCRGRLADLGHRARRRPGRRGALAGRACGPCAAKTLDWRGHGNAG